MSSWHAEAQRLYRPGVRGHGYKALGRRFGVTQVAVYFAINPDKRRPKSAVAAKRHSIRRMARQEAAATGIPVDQVYARFGVSSFHHSRKDEK